MEILDIVTGSVFNISFKKQSGEETMTCPECSKDRKKKNVKCLSWNHEKNTGFCHHCEGKFIEHVESKKEYEKPKEIKTPLSDKTLSYFESRGISKDTVNRFNITEFSDSQKWICFNYYDGSDLINRKYRSAKKEFRLETGCKLIPYNLNSVRGSDKCYIVEGEFDALTLYECGFKQVISVPNGAHKKNNNLDYLEEFINEFDDQLNEVVILTDGDVPGISLRNELARRFGKERSYYVVYPEGCKDSNDVLVKYGKDGVKKLVESKNEFPLEGIDTVSSIEINIDYIYKNGYPLTAKIGNDLDDHITWRTSEWTVITGPPGSGKSDVLDQISLALSINEKWKFGVFSPENKPYELHFWKLAQKFIGKMRKEMSPFELQRAKDFINDHFIWVSVIDLSLDALLSKAKELVKRKGINSFIIDPWNQIEHLMNNGQTETQYVSESLSKITSFCLENDIHMFIVAHPAKSRQVPGRLTLYDISGSAHFYNKCYNGLVVTRDYDKDLTLIQIEKVKFWFVGKAGKQIEWHWDITKGTRYFDLDIPVRTPTHFNDTLPFDNEKAPF